MRTGTLLVTVAITVLLPARSHSQVPYQAPFSFESPGLVEWRGGPPETLSQDSAVVQAGRYSGRIARDPDSPSSFSTYTISIPVEFSGSTLELRGWLKTESVEGFAGLWLREDGPAGSLQFDNMQSRKLNGTTDWTEYRITLPLHPRARTVYLGALLSGHGTVWVDELAVFVDGAPAWEAPPREPSPFDADTEFDEGSDIEVPEFTPTEVEKLSLLGRVWGFAKYHHPRIAEGTVNWDYELLRVLPAVVAAPDLGATQTILAEWLDRQGDPAPCEPCAVLSGDTHLRPTLDWIEDTQLVGESLSRRLGMIYEHRASGESQYYVSHAEGAGNPVFSNESAYESWPLPDAGFRLLALYRLWNIVEYWFPYRDVIGENWGDVLATFIPRVMGAASETDYRLALLELTARINDTHANLWRDLDVRPPVGSAALPVIIRFVEGRAVVAGFSHPELGPTTELEVGDVIESIDGQAIDSLIVAWRPFYAASNEPTRLRDMARSLTRGEPGPVRIGGIRASTAFEVVADRVPLDELDARAGMTHDLPGDAFQRLTDEVAYLKLSSVVAADVPDYLRRADGATVLVVDIRNYPNEFVPFALGGHLVTEPTAFARFTKADAANPGAFSWTDPVVLQPLEPDFPGKLVILVDETSLSQAEYTAMALRASPNALVVGSTTAGADGDVSPIPLPGGVSAMISGIGVFYPDRTPTQRVGIVPDIEVEPTIAGLRAGRDEVLEAAVSHALGREFRLSPSLRR